VQLANAVPLGRVRAKIGLRGSSPCGAHGCKPFAVAQDHRVGGIEAGQEPARHLCGRRAVRQAEERPASLTEALNQTGLGQKLEVTRDARLRLAQDFGQVGYGELGLGQQGKHAEPRGLAGRLEGGVELGKADESGGRGHSFAAFLIV
jgi:hypothetical protein